MLGHSRSGKGTALVLVFVAVGAAVPLLSPSPWAVFLSSILFGCSFLSVVTSVTAVARASLEPRHWTPAIGTLTVVFAVGQCLGPVLTGFISDVTAGLSAGLGVSAMVLSLAALCAVGQRSRPPIPLHPGR
jgi:predicted MFS family arabinose efflux permease